MSGNEQPDEDSETSVDGPLQQDGPGCSPATAIDLERDLPPQTRGHASALQSAQASASRCAPTSEYVQRWDPQRELSSPADPALKFAGSPLIWTPIPRMGQQAESGEPSSFSEQWFQVAAGTTVALPKVQGLRSVPIPGYSGPQVLAAFSTILARLPGDADQVMRDVSSSRPMGPKVRFTDDEWLLQTICPLETAYYAENNNGVTVTLLDAPLPTNMNICWIGPEAYPKPSYPYEISTFNSNKTLAQISITGDCIENLYVVRVPGKFEEWEKKKFVIDKKSLCAVLKKQDGNVWKLRDTDFIKSEKTKIFLFIAIIVVQHRTKEKRNAPQLYPHAAIWLKEHATPSSKQKQDDTSDKNDPGSKKRRFMDGRNDCPGTDRFQMKFCPCVFKCNSTPRNRKQDTSTFCLIKLPSCVILPPGWISKLEDELSRCYQELVGQESAEVRNRELVGQASAEVRNRELVGQGTAEVRNQALVGQGSAEVRNRELVGQGSAEVRNRELVGQASAEVRNRELVGQASAEVRNRELVGQASAEVRNRELGGQGSAEVRCWQRGCLTVLVDFPSVAARNAVVEQIAKGEFRFNGSLVRLATHDEASDFVQDNEAATQENDEARSTSPILQPSQLNPDGEVTQDAAPPKAALQAVKFLVYDDQALHDGGQIGSSETPSLYLIVPTALVMKDGTILAVASSDATCGGVLEKLNRWLTSSEGISQYIAFHSLSDTFFAKSLHDRSSTSDMELLKSMTEFLKAITIIPSASGPTQSISTTHGEDQELLEQAKSACSNILIVSLDDEPDKSASGFHAVSTGVETSDGFRVLLQVQVDPSERQKVPHSSVTQILHSLPSCTESWSRLILTGALCVLSAFGMLEEEVVRSDFYEPVLELLNDKDQSVVLSALTVICNVVSTDEILRTTSTSLPSVVAEISQRFSTSLSRKVVPLLLDKNPDISGKAADCLRNLLHFSDVTVFIEKTVAIINGDKGLDEESRRSLLEKVKALWSQEKSSTVYSTPEELALARRTKKFVSTTTKDDALKEDTWQAPLEKASTLLGDKGPPLPMMQTKAEETGSRLTTDILSSLCEAIVANIFENFDAIECQSLVLVSKTFRRWVESYQLPFNARTFKRWNPDSTDGEHILFYYSRKKVPFQCYLVGLDTPHPLEYLSLPSGPDKNFSLFPNGGSTSGTSLRTSFQKIRLNPMTLKVKTDDYTFSSTTGGPLQQIWGDGTDSYVFKAVPYAVARDCVGLGSTRGQACIDLRGTPFAIASSFGPRGFAASGSSSSDNDNQVVELRGGGYCGGIFPNEDQTCGQGPSGGWALQLTFVQR